MKAFAIPLSAALWLTFAAPAYADADHDFLNALRQGGIAFQDPDRTITRGHLVCKAVTSGGFSYSDTVFGMARTSGSTVAAENAFAAIAIGFLCADQKNLVMPAQSSFPVDARIDLS